MIENNDTSNDSILYEVIEYLIRKQEPEITKYKNDSVILPTPGNIKNALRYLNNRYSLPESISQQISYTLPWKFAIGNKGNILAIVQENIIEIRKSKDEYSSIFGKASVPKDAFPQWRKLAWSPDGLILVLASSNGYLSFYNSFGNNIFNINPKSVSQNPQILEAGDAIASIIFKQPNVKIENCDYEFIRITYSGLLKSYYICGNEFSENHEFSFGNFYRNGVNCVAYSNKHNMFFVAGNSVSQNLTCTASQIGLTCWRTLIDHPYYKLSISMQDYEIYKSPFSIWNFIPIIKNRSQSVIFKTSISPNNCLISCLHTDGTISIWSLPTLKLQKQWKLLEQSNYNAKSPLKMTKCKKSLNDVTEFQPLDIGWWSDNTIIIARYSGSVSVCSINSLQNLLGTSPEFLYNYPQIAELSQEKGFLCLDCEIFVTSTKRSRESNNEEYASELSSDSEKDEDESKPVTILSYTTNLMQSVLYSITDIENFQPKRKKSKVCHRTYRLLGLKSTTPEELYSRKIEIEEYEEALALATNYNLDPDLVYQTQWRKSEFSINAIQKFLSKVTKRSWVLNECISRVPENLEATRELINFGLRGANLETLISIGIKDDGKFVSTEINNDVDNHLSNLESNQMQKNNETLNAITMDKLNESQKELIKYRMQLLNHLDKLKTYEILLGSTNKFDKKFYEEFRQLSPVENAIRFAKKNNCQGVEIMFTYYGIKLIPHWLAIISFFPETLNPEKYQKLLPECDIEGRLFLLYQEELRQKDWVERSTFCNIILDNNDDVEFIYESRRSLAIYRNKELTQAVLQKWYKTRAYEIERDCCLVDNALILINIGKSHNITGLEDLLLELETLADLVYKVNLEDLSLTEVEKLNDLEKVKLLMTKCNEKNFVLNIKTMLLPYSRRRKRYLDDTLKKDLLCEYLVFLSTTDLTLPIKFFEYLKSSYDFEILDSIENINELAIDCIYACTDVEMYTKAKVIFDDTVIHLNGRKDSSKKYDELEKELKCLHTLNQYQIKIPLYRIVESKQNFSDAKALFIQMADNLIKIPSLQNDKDWSQILNDMIYLKEQIFSCLDIETCFEITMIMRLKSGSKTVIQGCTSLIEMKKTEGTHLKVSYEKATELVLQASNEYFNNSKSLRDPYMNLAKDCLDLITEDNERVKDEYDLIQALEILNEFQINVLPLQVRMTHERLKFIEDCLNSRHDSYKNIQKLINLAKYLRIEPKNIHLREGKILNLIAKKAFDIKDYNFCSSIIKNMMVCNYYLSWNIALDLAYCNEYDDLKFRYNCIWFAINNGPSEIIENLMKYANLLQIQILNSDLENCLSTQNENSDVHNLNKDFNDELQVENNELVPKIVQTSTNLVKSSAQIVKQSTFDLIKNAGNKNFWKSKLNFTFMDNFQKNVAEDEIIEMERENQLQKFPCFYETLHENCGISNLDTKYSKYFKNDDNSKLKLCQILLRISLLSETASYGTEISNINHLLHECVEYTITEDCMLGLSYLLNLDDDFLINNKNISESFPQIELYYQMLAYFYSIKLYSRINSEIQKALLYDPIELIQQMATIKIINDTDNSNHKFKQQINISNNKLNIKEKLTLEYIHASAEADEWNNWGDEWIETCDSMSNTIETNNCPNFLHFTNDNLSIEKFYETFEEELSKIHSIDDYRKMKQMLIQWSNINNVDFENTYSNLTSKMIIRLIDISKNNNNNNEKVLKIIKDLLQEKLISQKIFIQLLHEQKNIFSCEQYIYLQLCSKELSLQQEAIDYIKKNYKTLDLNTEILQEIFFNNLTCLFNVSHDLYYRILEEVFVNCSLPEIENNIKLLIENLVKQKNIPHAIVLLNQLEDIPPSLSTYENCINILLRK
ncbi:PREDICTED: neuroblastoma-amplified sequence-like [Ceratosolen solmsi marchali]|uniref:Neuroblastoma-amplified sequence-like n=1 Tax=Ceratosolen solmsi marchali TaxID=326594 RepID=A0AAJ7DUT7_9HYME|nr:PREDICTED: neuroblastoma-amplified sequence-like [Ceratosolen solmsi marchali]